MLSHFGNLGNAQPMECPSHARRQTCSSVLPCSHSFSQRVQSTQSLTRSPASPPTEPGSVRRSVSADCGGVQSIWSLRLARGAGRLRSGLPLASRSRGVTSGVSAMLHTDFMVPDETASEGGGGAEGEVSHSTAGRQIVNASPTGP